MRKIYSMIAAISFSISMIAQDIDKAKVEASSSAAKAARGDLQKIDTGDKAWKFSGTLGLNAAATGLVNWAAGGNNNINGVAYTNLRLLYHENNMAWDTKLDLEYGMSWIDQKYDKFQKSSDKINFTTKFGWEFHKSWYLTVLGGFKSQFAYGRSYTGDENYDNIVSKFLAPAYTDLSLGIDWKPNDIFSVYISPIAGRFTSVSVGKKLNNKLNEYYPVIPAQEEAEGATGLERVLKESYSVWKYVEKEDGTIVKDFSKNVRAELGLSFNGSVNYTYKDLKISSTLGLFTPYAWKKKMIYQDAAGAYYTQAAEGRTDVGYLDNNRRFGNFDVDWDVALSYQFLKCLQVTVSTSMKYYNGVKIDKTYNRGTAEEKVISAERVQFKGLLGIGVGYSF